VDRSRHEAGHVRPIFLADGRRFLYLARERRPRRYRRLSGRAGFDGARRVLAVDNGVGVAGQHLLTLSKGILTARSYDADRAEVGAAPLTIAEGLVYDSPQRSGPAFAAAGSVVAFRSANPDSRLVWFDREGRELGAFPGRADYHHPWLSPDERRVATEKTDPATGMHTIWILDVLRGTASRLLPAPDGAHNPVWSPDGRRIVYSTNRNDTYDLYEIAAEGGNSRVVSHTTDGWLNATDWSLDGRYLMFAAHRRGNSDLVVVPMSPAGTPQPFVETTAEERQGQFSPDARWAAYTSDESGAPEVYVRRFPPTESKWQVSVAGGAQPHWRRDGREIFYLAPDGKLMAVDVRARPAGLELGQPHALVQHGNRRLVRGPQEPLRRRPRRQACPRQPQRRGGKPRPDHRGDQLGRAAPAIAPPTAPGAWRGSSTRPASAAPSGPRCRGLELDDVALAGDERQLAVLRPRCSTSRAGKPATLTAFS
jgi:hypothetical protein